MNSWRQRTFGATRGQQEKLERLTRRKENPLLKRQPSTSTPTTKSLNKSHRGRLKFSGKRSLRCSLDEKMAEASKEREVEEIQRGAGSEDVEAEEESMKENGEACRLEREAKVKDNKTH